MRKQKIELYNIDSVTQILESSKPRVIKTERKNVVKPEQKDNGSEDVPVRKIDFNPVYRYDLEGHLIDKYLNGHQMAKKLGWKYVTVNLGASEERITKGYFLSRKNYTPDKAHEIIASKSKPKKVKTVKEKKVKLVNDKPKTDMRGKHKRVKVDAPKSEKTEYIQIHKIYQYAADGNLIGEYDNAGLLAKAVGLNHSTCVSYARQKRVYNGFLLSREALTPPQVKQRFTDALKASQITYIYDCLGVCVKYTTRIMEVREFLNTRLTSKQISGCKAKENKLCGYMLSGTYYSVDIARQKYESGRNYKPYKV